MDRILRVLKGACVSAVLLCATVSVGHAADAAPKADDLKVIVTPSKAEVRVGEAFKVELRVENTTQAPITILVWNCSWSNHWKSSDPQVQMITRDCKKNFKAPVEIPVGGAYTKELEMVIHKPVDGGKMTFRMGFTPIGSPKTYWSEDVTLKVTP